MKAGADPPGTGLRLKGETAGRVVLFPLLEGRLLVLGCDAGSDLPLRHAGVSRRHAAVEAVGGLATVRDLGSKNGTFVNGLRVEEARLGPGDWLQLGPVRLVLERVDGADTSLAIEVERKPREGPPRASEQVETDTRVPGAVREPSAWLEALERVLSVVDDGAPGSLYEALDELVRGIGARGALLVERRPDGAELVVATGGRPPDADSPEPRVRAERVGPAGTEITLSLTGEFPSREAVLPLLRIVLGAAAKTMPAPHPRAPERPRARPEELKYPPGTVRGRAPAICEMERELQALVRNELPVLVLGETGAGKELVARTLHHSSPRNRGPYVAINCAAIQAELLEAELFGVARGAATGVVERRGALEMASGGVLLLDEIGELALALQAKLLRALQEREVHPVGATLARPVDLRVVSATNIDIEARVESGAFRRDLFYRLAGAVVRVPPLRERREDIPRLVAHFLHRSVAETRRDVRGVTVKALEILARAPWPGNVRQLEYALRRLVSLCPEGQAIDSGLLPVELGRQGPGILESKRLEDGPFASERSPEAAARLSAQVDELERRSITAALEGAGGNRSLAARRLGLSRNGLAMKLRRFGIR